MVQQMDVPLTPEERRFSEPEDQRQPTKKIFILLLLLACVVMVGLAFLLWWVPYVGLSNIHRSLPGILAIFLGGFVLFWLGGALTLVLSLIHI